MRFFLLAMIPLFLAACSDAEVVDCRAIGGEIVNTLVSEYGEYDARNCPAGTTSAGVIEGMQCPCICCVPN